MERGAFAAVAFPEGKRAGAKLYHDFPGSSRPMTYTTGCDAAPPANSADEPSNAPMRQTTSDCCAAMRGENEAVARSKIKRIERLRFMKDFRLLVRGGRVAEAACKIRVKQAVKEMFAALAADREASRDVGAGAEPALHRIADSHVFVLHFFADLDAGLVALERFCAYVGKIVVEDNGAFVHGEWKNEVRVHNPFVGVEHEIRIDPEIESAAVARGGDIFFGFGAGAERAGLQTRALEIFDGIAGVFNDATESFVGVGNVIAAVEIVIHVNFPIALQRVDAAIEKFEFLG